MKVHLNFTPKGQVAIDHFENGELIEIFTRYINTLTKHYSIEISVPTEVNQSIKEERTLKVFLKNVNCDVNTFFNELGRDVKVPLKKRLEGTGKLDNVFKIEVIK